MSTFDYKKYLKNNPLVEKKEIKEQSFNEIKKEIKFHLDQFYGGNIDGNDLANAVEEIMFGDIKAPGMMDEAVGKNSKGREFNQIYVDRISAGGMSKDYLDTEEFEDPIIIDIEEMMEEENSRVKMEFAYVDSSGKEHLGSIEFDELTDTATGTSDFSMDDEEEFRNETQMDPINVQDMILDKI